MGKDDRAVPWKAEHVVVCHLLCGNFQDSGTQIVVHIKLVSLEPGKDMLHAKGNETGGLLLPAQGLSVSVIGTEQHQKTRFPPSLWVCAPLRPAARLRGMPQAGLQLCHLDLRLGGFHFFGGDLGQHLLARIIG
ncbi:hypothetical protein [Acidithiobacillus sp.]